MPYVGMFVEAVQWQTDGVRAMVGSSVLNFFVNVLGSQ